MKKLIPLVALFILIWGAEACQDKGSRSVPQIEGQGELAQSKPDAPVGNLQLTPSPAEAKRTLAQTPEQAVDRVPASGIVQAPLTLRAVCVDEFGHAIEGVALTVVSLVDCPIAYSDATGTAVLALDRGLGRAGFPISAMKSVGAPVAVQLSKQGRCTRILYGPALEDLEQYDCGRVELLPAGTVTGRVVGPGGTPVVGASVLPAAALPELNEEGTRTLRVSGLLWSSLKFGGAGTSTDFEGRFRLDGLPTTALCVWSQASGTYAAWSDSIQLEPGEILDIGTMSLMALAPRDRIAGQVLNTNGSPSVGATLSCEQYTKTEVGPQTVTETDRNGFFLVPALEGATHRLRVRHSADISLQVSRDEVLGGTMDVVLRFEEGEPDPKTTGTVVGHVLLDGEPAPFATLVSFIDSDPPRGPKKWREHRANSVGRFALEVPYGSLRLEARGSDGASVGTTAEIEVQASHETEEVLIQLAPAAAIVGLVLSPMADKSGLEFRATGPHGQTYKTSSRADGSFEFGLLQPGPWTVKRISTSLFTSGDNAPHGAEPREVDLHAGETARLEFDMRDTALIDGIVAIGDQDLSTWSWSVEGIQGRFDSRGQFRVPAIEKRDEVYLGLGGRLAHSIVQVTRRLRLRPGRNPWSFEVKTGRVELRRLPLASQFPTDDSFRPVCTLLYEHLDGTVWEAMPLVATEGRTTFEHVPVGRVLVIRGGLGAARELRERPNSPVGQVLGEIEVRAGETASYEWRD